MTGYYEHFPVLLNESVDYLVTDPKGIYIDGTLGGGGHSKSILNRLDSEGHLYGIDQDPEALKAAGERIGNDERFTALEGNFGYLSTLIPKEHQGQITGILFDYGVSTHQIKEPERGFSFQHDGPLDMRMSAMSGVSAHSVVNEYDYKKLRDVIFHYGEERMSRQIAQEIINRRPIETTGELRDAVESVVKGRHSIKSVARVFQGIRIEVNREIEVLKLALQDSLNLLKVGGRIVAISYHSLEDRLVKYFFKSGNFEGKIEKDFYGKSLNTIEPVTKQIITPGEKEIETNPAARSAKMRVAVKISEVN
ncbi:16S rRNA (cytosine(1402)-N(4))-methyltransferase RsmH [Rhodohalobacter barkolensis]|uniref:Ribosomal RNA small subunit methyltransferase H n=1 Tax=Rhodohalobacter barkolensis TaxID=2053187 RepID=A0A2N0VLD4_9BACT|nr:16S rRNA (cytosine(1402)-N(4))-methyltransferase RsmH [Rhodohalobacter barkolensis]PKD44951.1 16S rRNA (cytosine(1402)-N(4))-methyltransferase RsmH [Rhodohalobacter barkolensis]